ncbi:Transglutaminase-activating metalloprotease [Streptomyces sp. RB5]|uniref:Transglutaminase-activating metalloprotease n=1 Tax=Streptomyces smaragdinus TaxID=2585196 RepID=A0A7K0CGM9_9ACTN|nr:M4 family metallopeptidase [Streptomyces smaragdinus]MQY12546.1 Transglutaminase-activating metalloprotease [Streptomyces smaragdinus]
MKSSRLTAVAAALALTAAGFAVGGTTATAAGPPAPPGAGKAAALAAADTAASSGLDELRHGPDETMVRTRVTPWANGLYYTAYERTYRGLPVAGGGDAVVLSDTKGRVRDVTGSAAAPISVGTRASVAADAAEATARHQLATVEEATAPELTVLLQGKKARLAWRTTVTGARANGTPAALETYVDARTGAVAQSTDQVHDATGYGYHNGTVDIDTSGSGSSYSMTDPVRTGLRCGTSSTAFTGPDNVWGNSGATNYETGCVDVMYAAQGEYDMLNSWFGYNGQNGRGGMVRSQVGLNDVNAYYDGSKTYFGHNQNSTELLTAIDVVAHEYGHEVFDNTPGSAGTSNENGGMNESSGDIFGALTEAYLNNPNDRPDYTVGEMMNFLGNNQPIRWMYNPSLAGDPNCYPQLNSGTEVHAAAGPQNHWFFLLAEGNAPTNGQPSSPICSGGPSSITGIGVQKAGKIFMGGLLAKTSNWNHLQARRATVAAAKNTYGSAECNAVKAAWNGIGVPVQSGEADCGGTNPGNDFSLSLNPSAGSVQPGASAQSTVSTATTSGTAQSVQLTASGAPAGVTVSFSPASVTSGGSSTMTVAVAAGTANGSYPITVRGTGSAEHTVTYNLTVGGGTPPTGCDNPEFTYQGTLSSGGQAVQPNGSYYYSTVSGVHHGCLRGPAGTDFDLYLQKWNGSTWTSVASGTTPEENEDVTYNGTAGYYRYVVHAYAGSGTYTLGVNNP